MNTLIDIFLGIFEFILFLINLILSAITCLFSLALIGVFTGIVILLFVILPMACRGTL